MSKSSLNCVNYSNVWLCTVPLVLSSSLDTLKFEIISNSIAFSSASSKEDVTADVISKLTTNPVIDGTALGICEVGEITGCAVGLEVTRTAHRQYHFKYK